MTLRRRKSKTRITRYKYPKTAAGGSGEGEGPGGHSAYKPGQTISCKVVRAESCGYSVVDIKNNMPGFMPSDRKHQIGSEVEAQFVCFDKQRLLLSERYSTA